MGIYQYMSDQLLNVIIIAIIPSALLVFSAVYCTYKIMKRQPCTYKHYERKRDELSGLNEMLEFLTANKKANDLAEMIGPRSIFYPVTTKNTASGILVGEAYVVTNLGLERVVISSELLSIALSCDDPPAVLQVVANKNGMDRTINGLLVRR